MGVEEGRIFAVVRMTFDTTVVVNKNVKVMKGGVNECERHLAYSMQ